MYLSLGQINTKNPLNRHVNILFMNIIRFKKNHPTKYFA